MKESGINHIAAGVLAISAGLGMLIGQECQAEAKRECKPVVIVTPSGQTEKICSRYNAVVDYDQGTTFSVAGGLALGAALVLVVKKPLGIDRMRNSDESVGTLRKGTTVELRVGYKLSPDDSTITIATLGAITLDKERMVRKVFSSSGQEGRSTIYTLDSRAKEQALIRGEFKKAIAETVKLAKAFMKGKEALFEKAGLNSNLFDNIAEVDLVVTE